MNNTTFSQYLKSLLDFLYPRTCKVCGRMLLLKEEHICLYCLKDIPLTYFWDWRENPAEKMLWGRTYIQRVIPLYFYVRESPYSELVHRIKYKGDIALAQYLGVMLGNYLKNATSLPSEEIECIVPVPLHPFKKWKRGYNQAEEISKGIALALWKESYCDTRNTKATKKKMLSERIVANAIRRVKFTKTQTKVGVESKWKNMEGAFRLKDFKSLENKHILLVDDVLTTGATVEACYEELKKIKNIKVTVATLAYVEQNH